MDIYDTSLSVLYSQDCLNAIDTEALSCSASESVRDRDKGS
jgi:hypothetical protein